MGSSAWRLGPLTPSAPCMSEVAVRTASSSYASSQCLSEECFAVSSLQRCPIRYYCTRCGPFHSEQQHAFKGSKHTSPAVASPQALPCSDTSESTEELSLLLSDVFELVSTSSCVPSAPSSLPDSESELSAPPPRIHSVHLRTPVTQIPQEEMILPGPSSCSSSATASLTVGLPGCRLKAFFPHESASSRFPARIASKHCFDHCTGVRSAVYTVKRRIGSVLLAGHTLSLLYTVPQSHLHSLLLSTTLEG